MKNKSFDKHTKILFTDLDGTLLNDEKQISPANQAAIEKALANGHKIVLSTGRSLASARIQAQLLGLTSKGCYAITSNGSQIYDLYHKKSLFEKRVPLSAVSALFEMAAAEKLYLQTYTDTQVAAPYRGPELDFYLSSTKMTGLVANNPVSLLSKEPFKLLAISLEDPEKLLSFQRALTPSLGQTVDSFLSCSYYLEIVPRGINKGTAVRFMCQYLDIPLENSIAAGDAQNDIAMLEAAAVGAVMCNASPKIYSHGTYVTHRDNNHDGLAEVIEQFML